MPFFELFAKKHHPGNLKKKVSLIEGVALMGGVGAGIFGIPFAIAKVGVVLGVIYIIAIGLLMMGLNLLIGEILLRTGGEYHLVGLGKKYLGTTGEIILSALSYVMMFAGLVIYITGTGQAIAALTGLTPFVGSLIFFGVMSLLLFLGNKVFGTAELILFFFIVFILALILGSSLSHVNFVPTGSYTWANLLFPYGVLLFAFHATASVPETYHILKKRKMSFKKAIIVGGIINICIYAAFAAVVIGVTGSQTTELATIGLGQMVGQNILILSNIFAIFAMTMSFLLVGAALRDSFEWDFRVKHNLSTLITLGIPALVFLLGLRSFIVVMNIVGGVFISIEVLLILLIYWRAKQKGKLNPGRYSLHHSALLGALLFLAFSTGAVYSIVTLF